MGKVKIVVDFLSYIVWFHIIFFKMYVKKHHTNFNAWGFSRLNTTPVYEIELIIHFSVPQFDLV